jgi:hypothetical protein
LVAHNLAGDAIDARRDGPPQPQPPQVPDQPNPNSLLTTHSAAGEITKHNISLIVLVADPQIHDFFNFIFFSARADQYL